MPTLPALSFSSIKTYKQCPKKFYHLKIAKDVVDTGSVYSLAGERDHLALELRVRERKALPENLVAFEPMIKAIEDKAKEAGKIIYVEMEMTLSKNFIATGWKSPDAWIRSKLDVLVVGQDSEDATVLDWKTGARRPDYDQLRIFSMQVFAHFPKVQRVNAAFVWLQDKAIDAKTYERDTMKALWSPFAPVIERMEYDLEVGSWQEKPSGLCNYCPAKQICPSGKRR